MNHNYGENYHAISNGGNGFIYNEKKILIDGDSLTIEDLYLLGYKEYQIKLTPNSELKVIKARDLVEKNIQDNKIVYGVNTGFGKFSNTIIPNDKIKILQRNIIRSHSVGVGDPLSLPHVRMLFALRINVLAKGYSGISLDTLNKYVDGFNKKIYPHIPEQGTVGASGDLCPLAHLAMGLMGEGLIWDFDAKDWVDASQVLIKKSYEPIELMPKEGIALINGTCFISALGSEALYRAEKIALHGTIISALSLEALKGSCRAFKQNIQDVRPHKGQSYVASILRSLLNSEKYPSQIGLSHKDCKKVQDSYTIRCIPQVHGIVYDTISFVKDLMTIEINSATDNPLVFAETQEILSGGNFHGEYPAKALDYLGIAIHEMSSISERRIERLVNTDLSHLPPFLIEEGGLNSGFMMAHVTAASLVSENKVLCHPASVDSLPTSASKEDHVSMGGFAARKSLKIVSNVENVLAIELLACCQALEFLRPLTTTEPLEAIHRLVRQYVPKLTVDRSMWNDIKLVKNLMLEKKIIDAVRPYLSQKNFFDSHVNITTSNSIHDNGI